MAVQNDILYTKTGEGTSAAKVGYENGPFQKWQTQPDTPANAGYPSLYDQSIGEVFTDVMPQVVFGGWREHTAEGNVVSFPRGNVYTEEDFDDSYVITQPLALKGRSGDIRTCVLDHVLKIGIIFQNFELRTSGSNRLSFEYQQAVEGLARKYETVTVRDLIAGGQSVQSMLTKDADGNVDIYNTILKVRKSLVERGIPMSDVDFYVTPDIVNLIMNDKHFISTFGNAPIAGLEVRNGFMGRYLGFQVYESGRLGGMTLTTPADMIFVARSQVIFCRFKVQDLMILPAPTTYIDCSILSGLEYFKHYIINDYGIKYLYTLAE